MLVNYGASITSSEFIFAQEKFGDSLADILGIVNIIEENHISTAMGLIDNLELES